MDIAITGSKGFIGSNLIPMLHDKHNIYEIDINHGYDIADKRTIKKIGKFDVIIHLAAKNFVPESYKHSLRYYYVNINSTLNVLELCKIFNARIIYVSSYVYGNPDYLPIDEKHPVKPFNPYSQSKIISEELVTAYKRDFNIDGIILRPFNIYGHNQNPEFLIPSIINQLKNGTINLKDPRPKRDFLYVADFCELITKCIDYDKKGVDIFNVGSGISYSIAEIVELLEKLIGHEKFEIVYTNNYRKEEILDVRADITKVKELLNWVPKHDLASGLKAYLEKMTILT
jgi:UDP-glucose 4-epimerase